MKFLRSIGLAISKGILFVFIFPVSWGNAADQDTIQYEWQLDDAQKERIESGVKNIVQGDTVEHVKIVLGDPYWEGDVYDKSGNFLFHVMDYYISRTSKNVPHNNDKVITFYFNREGKLIRVYRGDS